jgi:hypothetical protein
VFNLTDATQWVETYSGFSFVGFYNFIVDYFEEKMMLLRSSESKVCLNGGISEYLFCLEYCSPSDLSLQSGLSSSRCCIYRFK